MRKLMWFTEDLVKIPKATIDDSAASAEYKPRLAKLVQAYQDGLDEDKLFRFLVRFQNHRVLTANHSN